MGFQFNPSSDYSNNLLILTCTYKKNNGKVTNSNLEMGNYCLSYVSCASMEEDTGPLNLVPICAH